MNMFPELERLVSLGSAVDSRVEIVMHFSAEYANPNGDPDAGNLPRMDELTGRGLVSDVCIKRKIRNHVEASTGGVFPNAIYFGAGVVLNDLHRLAYEHVGIEPEKGKMPSDREKADEIRDFMCRSFWDIRTFGAMMSTEVNCGQVIGPVQVPVARSVDPVRIVEMPVTRQSVTNEKDEDKIRTMGRKYAVPFGLYRTNISVGPFQARSTGFGGADLRLLLGALGDLFAFDSSAARPAGSMAVRALHVFVHEPGLGRAPAHRVFETVRAVRRDGAGEEATCFADYDIRQDALPAGVAGMDLLA